MPIYEYVCQDCGTQFEKFVRGISSASTIECPNCKSDNVQKEFSLFGVGRSGNAGSLSSTAPAASCNVGGT